MIITKIAAVTGMQCGNCGTMIEEVVNRIDGIHHVKADFPKATVTISFDTNKTSFARIQTACATKGYAIELPFWLILNCQDSMPLWRKQTLVLKAIPHPVRGDSECLRRLSSEQIFGGEIGATSQINANCRKPASSPGGSS